MAVSRRSSKSFKYNQNKSWVIIIKHIPYGKHYIDNEDIDAVIEVLNSDFITQGTTTHEFEKRLAKYFGAKYAVVFNSGTSALHAAYFAMGLVTDDQIITSPITFVATSNAALYLGAKPLFSDVEIETGNINPALLEEKINENVKAIVPVHYAGNPADLDLISKISRENDLLLIEDAAHAIGASYKNSVIGSCRYSDMTIFSFHPVKHITTGEGGAVLTNKLDYYEKLLDFRSHGITKKNFLNSPDGDWYYEMHNLGFNYRMTDIQAALGISQLKKLKKFVERRRKIAKLYTEIFAENSYFDVLKTNENDSSYHLFPILLKDEYQKKKKEIFNILRSNKLGVQVHYIPVYRQPYYQDLGYNKLECPDAENFYEKEISIPIFPSMGEEDVNMVIEIILDTFKKIG